MLCAVCPQVEPPTLSSSVLNDAPSIFLPSVFESTSRPCPDERSLSQHTPGQPSTSHPAALIETSSHTHAPAMAEPPRLSSSVLNDSPSILLPSVFECSSRPCPGGRSLAQHTPDQTASPPTAPITSSHTHVPAMAEPPRLSSSVLNESAVLPTCSTPRNMEGTLLPSEATTSYRGARGIHDSHPERYATLSSTILLHGPRDASSRAATAGGRFEQLLTSASSFDEPWPASASTLDVGMCEPWRASPSPPSSEQSSLGWVDGHIESTHHKLNMPAASSKPILCSLVSPSFSPPVSTSTSTTSFTPSSTMLLTPSSIPWSPCPFVIPPLTPAPAPPSARCAFWSFACVDSTPSSSQPATPSAPEQLPLHPPGDGAPKQGDEPPPSTPEDHQRGRGAGTHGERGRSLPDLEPSESLWAPDSRINASRWKAEVRRHYRAAHVEAPVRGYAARIERAAYRLKRASANEREEALTELRSLLAIAEAQLAVDLAVDHPPIRSQSSPNLLTAAMSRQLPAESTAAATGTDQPPKALQGTPTTAAELDSRLHDFHFASEQAAPTDCNTSLVLSAPVKPPRGFQPKATNLACPSPNVSSTAGPSAARSRGGKLGVQRTVPRTVPLLGARARPRVAYTPPDELRSTQDVLDVYR